MRHGDANNAVPVLQSETVDQAAGMEVAEADTDSGSVHRRHDLRRVATRNAEGDDRQARLRVGHTRAVDIGVTTRVQVSKQSCRQAAFVSGHRLPGSGQFVPRGFAVRGLLQQVVEHGRESVSRLVAVAAGLTFVRDRFPAQEFEIDVVEGAQFIGLAVKHGHVGPEDLVAAEHVEVGIAGLHIGEAMGGPGHAVHHQPGSGGMCLACHVGDRLCSAEDIRAVSHAHEPGALIEQAVERSMVEMPRFGVHRPGPYDRALPGKADPGREVGFVVGFADDDFIAGFELRGDGAGQSREQRGAGGTEDDLVR